MRRIEPRWGTRFGGWVNSVTPARIAKELGIRGDPITSKAVYDWISGRTRPRPGRAMVLVELADGEISMADVFGQRERVGRQQIVTEARS